jgi:hypothetical protein
MNSSVFSACSFGAPFRLPTSVFRFPISAFQLFSLSAFLCFSAVPATHAQPATPSGQSQKAAEHVSDSAATLDRAKGFARGRNADAAEQELAQTNVTAANSPAWHLETAQRLVQLAEALVRDAHQGDTGEVLQRALQHLKQADVPSVDNSTRVAANLLAGFIHERFLADSRSALASYRAAARLAPNSTAAKEAVERRQRIDDSFRNRSSNGSN